MSSMLDYRPTGVGTHAGEAQERRPLVLLPEQFRLTTVPCPRCLGPMPQFVFERPEPCPDHRGMDWSRVGGYAKYSNIGASPTRCCRPCSLREAVARLCGGTVRERIADPATLELEAMRAKLAALNAPKRRPGLDELMSDSLVELGTVHVSPSVRYAAKPRGASPSQWAATIDALVNRHRTGDFGMNGHMPIHILKESRELGPLAEPSQQNAVAVLDDAGSVRSIYPRREDLPGHVRVDRGDVIHVWTELAAGSTLVYLPSDAVETD